MILWLISCWSTPQPTGVSADPFHSAPPRIVNLAAECSEEEGEWVFDVITEHWTGGGWVWLGTLPWGTGQGVAGFWPPPWGGEGAGLCWWPVAGEG